MRLGNNKHAIYHEKWNTRETFHGLQIAVAHVYTYKTRVISFPKQYQEEFKQLNASLYVFIEQLHYFFDSLFSLIKLDF